MISARSKTPAFTTLALVAFAANSLLCRWALGRGAIDPASFSTIRVTSGAVALLLMTRPMRHGTASFGGSWGSAALLFLYVVPFSFAYISLGAGTGALILFAAVQGTMLVAALRSGARPHPFQWVGLLLALSGLIYLVLPGLSAPAPVGCALMTAAGIAWGRYSLRGRRAADPFAETAGNFARVVPLTVLVSVAAFPLARLSVEGAMLAVLSGVLASGLGYVAWYVALTGLTATRAATVQLTVPAIAAAGGVAFLSEPITTRLVASGILILGGVLLALTRTERHRQQPRRPE
jgi:drug/metabolite transporter (DMT)-like permease